jgi:hypothetical protein
LHSNCKECQRKYGPPPKPRIPKPIKHGSRAGYLMEAYRRLPHCEECKIANTEYAQSLRA